MRMPNMWISTLPWMLFLSYGFGIPGAHGKCAVSQSQSQCTCTVDTLNNMLYLLPCLQVEELELQNGYFGKISIFNESQDILGNSADALNVMKFLHILPLRKITFRQVIISAEFLIVLLPFLAQSNIKELAFIQSRLIFSSQSIILPHAPFKIKSASLENVMVPSSFLAPDLLTLHEWLMKPLTKVLLTKTQISHLECKFISLLQNLEEADFSENQLVDDFLDLAQCPGALKTIRSLRLSSNNFKSYYNVCQTLQYLSSLENLDLSYNDFTSPPRPCSWQQEFQVFNLSHAHLKDATNYLPSHVVILDLSSNNLQVFTVAPVGLRQLYLSSNQLLHLPSLESMPLLEVLEIHDNNIKTFDKKVFADLQRIKSLSVGKNRYQCECSTKDAIEELTKLSSHLKYWPEDYVCDSPLSQQGVSLNNVHFSFADCNAKLIAGLIVAGCILVVAVVAGLVYRRFSKQRDSTEEETTKKYVKDRGIPKYDLFIAHCNTDSAWVMSHLMPALKHYNSGLDLCYGGPVETVWESRRTLIVVSSHYLNTEWVNYELEFSQCQEFEKLSNSVLLVLLEPFSKEALPRNYRSLQTLMSTRTCIEWPDDETLQTCAMERLLKDLKL
ncbi:toll-like receptor 2 isoform X2 [Erpetoichthys calabaricus]|uniref:toll-like receptor 2 isoform X2 n=1 Tax=Erpetoichthys calabaricus TaxID=27687 RepID=UPI00223499E5|nr:toll-like receptor 2 isoform X2 [Erpetoichthys calabaricus]